MARMQPKLCRSYSRKTRCRNPLTTYEIKGRVNYKYHTRNWITYKTLYNSYRMIWKEIKKENR